MAAEQFPVCRLTQEAYDQLSLVASEAPEVYLDPEIHFGEVLVNRGVTDYAKETGLYSNRPVNLKPVSGAPPNRADIQALAGC